jgi:glycine/D-amino acid oxidase-like deaminating enzyme
MKLSSGLPFSLIRYGLPFNYPKLETDISTEVVIIGGGISGALMACYLVDSGLECVVVDKRTIGLGSTVASTSLLQYEIDVSLNDLIGLRGESDAIQAYRLCNEALDKLHQVCKRIDFKNFTRANSLYYGVNKSDSGRLQLETKKRKSIGLDVEYLDESTVRSKYSMRTHGAILSSNAAYVDAYRLTHALLQYSIEKGARVYDRTPITKNRQNNDGFILTTGENVKIKARHVIYATGYETSAITKKKIVDLRSTYVTVSESMSNCETLPFNQTLIWNTADPYLYLRCTEDGRILVGGRDDDFANPTRRDKAISRKSRQLANDLRKLIPFVNFLPEFSWAGTFATTKDGLPFIGHYPGQKNSYYALGYGGNGIIFSLIAAEIIRDLILGKKNDATQLFRFDRI